MSPDPCFGDIWGKGMSLVLNSWGWSLIPYSSQVSLRIKILVKYMPFCWINVSSMTYFRASRLYIRTSFFNRWTPDSFSFPKMVTWEVSNHLPKSGLSAPAVTLLPVNCMFFCGSWQVDCLQILANVVCLLLNDECANSFTTGTSTI